MNLNSIKTIGVLISVLGTSRLQAATYYVDYSGGNDASNGISISTPWMRCPGMVGFTGNYIHAAGDVFVFKGGVSWPGAALPLTIRYSGSGGNLDAYTTDHTWYLGTAWSQPTLDGQQAINAAIIADGKSHFLINDLKIVNVGTARTSNSKRAMQMADCSNFTISNNTIAAEVWLGIYVYAASAGNRSDIRLLNNDISNAAQAIVVATSAANSILDNVDINGNHIHDLASQIGGGVHGDGIHTWATANDDSQYISSMKIRNNRFSGSFARTFGTTGGMTAWIYVADSAEGVEIHNNYGSYSDPPTDGMFEALISLRGISNRGGRHKIYNNTLVAKNPGISAGILMGDGLTNAVPNCDIRNNILTGMRFALNIANGSQIGLQCDYNYLNSADSDVAYFVDGFKSPTQLRALGINTHGSEIDPKLVSTTDLSLQSTSPCKDVGSNLGTLWAIDAIGIARPQGSGWDIGAFERLAGSMADTTAPVISAVAAGQLTGSSAFITWTTDEPATTMIEYGVTTAYGSTASSSSLITSHGLTVNELTSGTTYHYRVKSADASGNLRTSGNFTITTPVGDITAPVISAVAAGQLTGSSALVTWTTDEPATTIIEYGFTTAYGSTASSSALTTSHGLTVSGLTTGTVYQYQVKSADASGNLRTSGNFTFTTQIVDSTPPSVTVTGPSPGVLSGNVTLTANATDNVLVAGVQFLVNAQPVGAEDTTPPYAVSWNSLDVANSVHSISARARDAAGNTTTSVVVSVQVQNGTTDGLANGLVGHWGFSEGSGVTSAPVGGVGGTVTLQTGVTWVPGTQGKALKFDGAYSFALVADAPTLRTAGSWSVALWIKHTTLPASGTWMMYLDKGQDGRTNYAFGINNSDQGLKLYFEFEDTTGSPRSVVQNGNVAMELGVWYQISVVFDDANNLITFFKDGNQVGNAAMPYSPNGSLAYPLNIGKQNIAGWEFALNGALDELRLYNRPLAATEVMELYRILRPLRAPFGLRMRK